MLSTGEINEVETVEQDLRSAAKIKPRSSVAEDYKECRRVMRAASKNYTFASLFLDKALRPHVEALYALVRVGDDRVDVTHAGFDCARSAIMDWQEAYWRAFETGDSPHPVLRAYLHTANIFNIPPETLSNYFRAMVEDLTVSRYATFNDLLYYIEGSANTVGRALCFIFGTRTTQVSDAFPAADSLAIAMQLSNFWRDVGEDWRRHRIYIPLEDMERFKVSESNLQQGNYKGAFTELMKFEIARTRGYYKQARSGIPLLRAGHWGVLNSLELYQAILDDIEKNQYDVFTKRAGAGLLRKINLVLMTRRSILDY
jgi:15-cis-phytoene synthase